MGELSMTFCILTPILGKRGYYEKYHERYWIRLLESFKGLGYSADFEVSLMITGDTSHFNRDLLESDIQKAKVNPRVSVHIEYMNVSGPARGTHLKLSILHCPADYYTFIDFDDSVSTNYFKKVVQLQHKEEIVVASAVRESDGDILLKPYLIWDRRSDETKWQYFLRGGYGNVIWGRFFSRNLLLRAEARLNSSFDRSGFGEEYKLHNYLFTLARSFGSTVGIYKWNYGDRTSVSKSIDWNEAVSNIKASLSVVPEEYQERVKTHYLMLLDICYNSQS